MQGTVVAEEHRYQVDIVNAIFSTLMKGDGTELINSKGMDILIVNTMR